MNSIYEVRILIVDDNKDLLRLLCEQLSGAGYRHIQTAANCAAAKKLFAAEIPELMILDINLPDGVWFFPVPCPACQSRRSGSFSLRKRCRCGPFIWTRTWCR